MTQFLPDAIRKKKTFFHWLYGMRNKIILYLFQCSLGALNQRPDGSNSGSEFSGYEAPTDFCLARLSNSQSDISQSCLCGFPITFPCNIHGFRKRFVLVLFPSDSVAVNNMNLTQFTYIYI